jgi:two-component system cell cycle sensor histidine kinase/response regulator CckA
MADAPDTSADVTRAPSRARRMSLTVAIVYALIGAAWILFSDMAVDALISDPAQASRVQTMKGLPFVFVSAAVLYWLVFGQARGLEASERRYRSIVETASEGIGIIDADGRLSFANRRLQALLGHAADAVTGRRLIDHVAAAERDAAEQWLARARTEAAGPIELSLVGADGVTRTALISAAPRDALDTSGGGVLAMFADVTALRRSEARFRTIVEAAPIGIMLLDADGRRRELNPAGRRLLGAEHGRAEYCLFDDPQLPVDLAARLRRGLVVRYRAQVGVGAAGATKLLVDVVVTPLAGEGDAPPGYLALLSDVTERERLEAQLRHAQKMEAIGQLSGAVAHDFNNILTAILGAAELARGALERQPDNAAAILPDLDQIERSAQRAATLTRQLLAFGRRQAARPQVVAPARVLGELQDMLRRLMREDLQLHFVLPPDAWPVRIDPGQLEQVVMNLVVNARDATPAGGLVAVELSNVDLTEDYVARHLEARTGPHVQLAVSDTGCGIPPETLSRIFEPFFTTKGAGTGTGLGLATVHGIVHQLGGHIMVYSEVGRGTTIRVLLPAEPQAAATPAENGRRPATTQRGSETVLVCEDDATVRALTCRTLESRGYTVLEADTPPRAIALVRAHRGPLQLLVTDVVMPELNGCELAQALLELRPELRVLYISGYTASIVAHHGVAQVATSFLEKPFTAEQLAQRVRAVLDAPATDRPMPTA